MSLGILNKIIWAGIGTVIFVLFYTVFTYNSDVSKIVDYQPKLTTQILDRNNELIANVFDREHRLYVPFEKIPPRLIEALVAIEDTAFFEHGGVNYEAIVRAAYKVIRAGKAVEGASTITQQLVKNVLLTREKTILRKFKEAILSIRIENEISKEMILERYLNEIYFGHGYYGVKAAARGYFHKELNELTLKEMALLCGLPRAPSFYDPTKHKGMSVARANLVLDRMKHLGWINSQEYALASAEIPVIFDETVTANRAPYAVDAVINELSATFDDVRHGGYVIYTTIDMEAQKAARAALKMGYEAAKERVESQRPELIMVDVVGEDGNITQVEQNATLEINSSKLNGALVSIEQHTGKVLALCGGVDFYKSQFNRAIHAKRQVGSSFKPFLYLAAFDLGYSPSSVVADISRTYKFKVGEGNETEEQVWRPSNYERNFVGVMSAREAVVHSRNLASINLVDTIGLELVRNRLFEYGFEYLPNDLSLALGSITLTPMQMSEDLTIISNYGERVKPYMVEKVVNKYGETFTFDTKRERVTTPAQAYLMIDVMRDVVRRGTGRRARIRGIEMAGKTGTTNDNRDAWFCGYTPSTQTVVWFGNDDNSQIAKRETGGKTAAPVFRAYYEALLKARPEITRHFAVPDGIQTMKINGKEEIFTDISRPPKVNKIMQPSKEELLF